MTRIKTESHFLLFDFDYFLLVWNQFLLYTIDSIEIEYGTRRANKKNVHEEQFEEYIWKLKLEQFSDAASSYGTKNKINNI